MERIKPFIKPILKIFLGCVVIVFFYIIIGKMFMFDFKWPEIVNENAISQQIPEIIKEKAQNYEYYIPEPLAPDDQIVFTELIQYNNQISVATGYLLHKGSPSEWYVILKHLPLTKDYIYDTNTHVVTDQTHFPDADTDWVGTTDFGFFFSKDIYISKDNHEVTAVTNADLGRMSVCVIALAGFVAGTWKMHKRKAAESVK
jgi:hypothetical protein